MFRTDLLSIITSLDTVFTVIGICHTIYSFSSSLMSCAVTQDGHFLFKLHFKTGAERGNECASLKLTHYKRARKSSSLQTCHSLLSHEHVRGKWPYQMVCTQSSYLHNGVVQQAVTEVYLKRRVQHPTLIVFRSNNKTIKQKTKHGIWMRAQLKKRSDFSHNFLRELEKSSPLNYKLHEWSLLLSVNYWQSLGLLLKDNTPSSGTDVQRRFWHKYFQTCLILYHTHTH